jgi:ABC-type lipoprotein release transport system permease subunit
MRGIQLGTYEVNIRHMVRLFSGHIQLQQEGFQENPSLQKTFIPDERITRLLESDGRILASAKRVVGDGLVGFGETSVGALIMGIDPEAETQTSTLFTKMKEGRPLTSSVAPEIVVGHTLLDNLKARIGDEVVVLAQGFDGSLGNMKYRIVGTIKTGSPEFDGATVLMGLEAAQELLATYGRVSVIALLLEDLPQIDEVKESLHRSLAGSGVVALDWREVMPDFAQSIQLDNISGMLMLGILIVVVAFGITNTVLMSVTERFREFGIVLAIGMPQTKLAAAVLIETLMIVVVGLMLGNILAAGVNYYLVLHPIEFGGQFEAIYEEYGFLPRIESTMRPGIFLNSSLAVLVISLLSAIYPLSRVLRLEPLKGIRYT